MMTQEELKEQEADAYEELTEALIDAIGPRLSPPIFADLTIAVMHMLAQAFQDGYDLGYSLGSDKRKGKVH
jgi:hypothetical protein